MATWRTRWDPKRIDHLSKSFLSLKKFLLESSEVSTVVVMVVTPPALVEVYCWTVVEVSECPENPIICITVSWLVLTAKAAR